MGSDRETTALVRPRKRSPYQFSSLWRTQPLQLAADTVESMPEGPEATNGELKKCLTLFDLVAYGVASTVGAGIFVVTGVVAQGQAGPGIVFSFLVAAFVSLLSAFCYSEFAARFPVSGSAYTFSYVALGEIVGWLVGWNLTLEYAISASAAAAGWGSYVVSFFEQVGVPVPGWLGGYVVNDYIVLSPLAALIVVATSSTLLIGVKESTTFNKCITVLNVSSILFVIGLGSFHINRGNYHPFFPFGAVGVFSGAGTVFFSFIGFDAVTTLAGETQNPKRDLPLGIIGTLGIATLLYVAVSLVVCGMQPYQAINPNSPLSSAFSAVGLRWAAGIIAFCSVTTLTATTLASLIGQPRIFFQMAKDGLFYKPFGTVSKNQTPVFGTVVTGVAASVLALIFDLNTLADMISIGTLMAFTVVCGGVIVLRYREDTTSLKTHESPETSFSYVPFLEPFGRAVARKPALLPLMIALYGAIGILLAVDYVHGTFSGSYMAPPIIMLTMMVIIWLMLQSLRPRNVPRTFKCPLVPLVPLLGVFFNLFLICNLPVTSIYRVMGWSAVGVFIYVTYGIRHSRLNVTEDRLLVNSAAQ
eukprot:TRINITY_DN5825_c0_g1_i2.p1 TRINITY_DN5825_c0_g1~~TRINITY_DN5825_c0_g1_i2.p1  ORF type:complete len:586 (-),score=193.81 TRINITY_DN5825_c0_g1_i2:290-2047(-)